MPDLGDQETRDILGHDEKYLLNKQTKKPTKVHVCDGEYWVVFALMLLNLNFSCEYNLV